MRVDTAKKMGSPTVLGICLGLALACAARQVWSADQEVDADKAMNSIGSPTWYDKDSKSYAPPTVSNDADDPTRRDGWIAERKNAAAKKKSANAANAGGSWNWNLNGLDGNLFSTIVFVLLASVLVGVIALLTVHSLRNYMPGRWEKTTKPGSIEIDPAKISELPFEVRRANYDNPLAEAEALMRAGRFREAILFLYGYMLLALDQSRKLELQKGKTNRMYLREVRQLPRLRSILAGVMLTFEDVYFGKHEISEERFLVHWRQMEEFHQLASSGNEPLQTSPITASIGKPAST